MAIKPNTIYTVNGVLVNEKIIPDGTVWKDGTKAKKAGFKKGDLYKKQQKLNKKTGKPLFVTIHNTGGHKNIDDEGELYTRATYNENMGSARVHFYVDSHGAWQNLKAGTGMSKNDPEGSAEVSWHAGDGSAPDGGNYTSLSMEIIMGEASTEINDKAYDNGARLTAWLLWKHGLSINDVVSHTYWVNKKAGKKFADRDEQSTNLIYGGKWCPTYIFNSTQKATALKNWKAFKAVIGKYLDELKGNSPEPVPVPEPSKPENEGKTFEMQLSVLKRGSKGEEVKSLQILLEGRGFDVGSYGYDGTFGGDTEKAVMKFQRQRGLVADGMCGPDTWNEILKG